MPISKCMIQTNNAIFLHLPKTAGTWITKILDPIIVGDKSVNHEFLKNPRTDKKVFTFVRNPWDWHKSLYMHDFFETELPKRQPTDTIQLVRPSIKSFPEFISSLSVYSEEFIEKLIRINRIRTLIKDDNLDPYEIDFLKSWNLSKKGAYQHLCECFTKYTNYVGRYENLKEDLTMMLEISGDMTKNIEKNIADIPKINYTQSLDYGDLYDDKTKEIVEIATKDIIDRFGYSF